jgi:hypothetical protein
MKVTQENLALLTGYMNCVGAQGLAPLQWE